MSSSLLRRQIGARCKQFRCPQESGCGVPCRSSRRFQAFSFTKNAATCHHDFSSDCGERGGVAGVTPMSRYASKRVLRETVGSSADWNHFARRNKILDAVNLGQGFCDFVPPKVSQLLQEGLADTFASNPLNQYSDSRGLPALRESLSSFMNQKYDFGITSDNVCVLPSATAALFAAIQAVVDPGDEVVVFEPFFPWYPAIVRAAGGVPRFVTLDPANDFALPPTEELAQAFCTEKTKLCIFNTPHNPTGRVSTPTELEVVAHLCVEHDVVCLSDEVYESCIFPSLNSPPHTRSDNKRTAASTSGRNTDNNGINAAVKTAKRHMPIALLPGMSERTITVGSASKLLSVTGWRVGWAVAHSPALLDITATMHSFNTFCAPTPLQHATAIAVDGLMKAAGTDSGDASPSRSLDIAGVGSIFEENARKLTQLLTEHMQLQVYPCESGYFVIADVQRTGLTGLEFCDLLLDHDEARVIAFPMSLFYDSAGKESNTMVRFSICKTPEYIDRALSVLAQIPMPHVATYR